jgi:hypothetical protein
MIHNPPPTLASLWGRLGVDPKTGLPFPSVGTTNVPLAVALDRVAAAERSLEAARTAARDAARREGKRTSGIFSDGAFIPRATALAWCDSARKEGADSAAYDIADALKNPDRRFAKLDTAALAAGLRLFQQRGQHSTAPVSEVERVQAEILAARQPDLSGNRKLGAPDNPVDLAAAIHKAAARAKSPTGTADPPPEGNALSRAIVEAGRKRRMESDEQ